MDVPSGLAYGAIPATVAGPVTEDRLPVLLWAYAGTASVQAGGIDHRLSAGEAIWIPPGVTHRTRAEPNSLLLPVYPVTARMSHLPDPLATVRTFVLPSGWGDWLIQQHVDGFHVGIHVRDALPGVYSLLGLVAVSREANGDPRAPTGTLPLPSSREARSVARLLLRDPGSHLSVELLAAQQNVSVKTLQRQFRRETAMVFSEWRTRVRVAAAATHLADGRAVGWTARRVGYATSTGLARAFKRHLGVTPREHARLARPRSGEASETVAEIVGSVAAFALREAPEPPVVPSRRTWTRVEAVHYLLWVYRGEVQVRIGSRDFSLRQGDAIWVPAGMPHAVEYATRSIAVPIGNSYARVRLSADDLSIFRFPAEADAFLLHASITSYSLSQPDAAPQPSFTEELFRTQFLAGRATETTTDLTGAVAIIAAALRRDPADSRSLADWSTHLGTTPRELGGEFVSQTGCAFPRWRAQLRMDMARWYLHLGDAPGQVAARVGYASPAAFGNAFATAHGMPPREYQLREYDEGALSARRPGE